jgi:hypothetical protein
MNTQIAFMEGSGVLLADRRSSGIFGVLPSRLQLLHGSSDWNRHLGDSLLVFTSLRGWPTFSDNKAFASEREGAWTRGLKTVGRRSPRDGEDPVSSALSISSLRFVTFSDTTGTDGLLISFFRIKLAFWA